MPNLCSSYKIRGCPASFYLSCPAYLGDMNCWEAQDKRCCSTQNLAKCSVCPVHDRARAAMAGEERSTA